jgi:hypothetical protein
MHKAADAAREVCQAFADSQQAITDEQRCNEGAFYSADTPETCEQQRTACLAQPAPAEDPLNVDDCAADLMELLTGCSASALEVEVCARAELAHSATRYGTIACAEVGKTSVSAEESVLPECEALYAQCPELLQNSFVEDGGFVCNDGRDIVDQFVCDGFADCAGSEDESGCSASDAEPGFGYDTDPNNLFTCDASLQIPGEWVCDGYADCADQSDEAGCQGDSPAGGDSGFVCEDGFDIPDSAYCDSFRDCANGEDEADCGSEDTDEDAGVGADGGA